MTKFKMADEIPGNPTALRGLRVMSTKILHIHRFVLKYIKTTLTQYNTFRDGLIFAICICMHGCVIIIFFTEHDLTEIRTRIINYIDRFTYDVFTHPCLNLNGSLIKMQLRLRVSNLIPLFYVNISFNSSPPICVNELGQHWFR